MKKLLVIVGATATGKTSLALHLSKKFNGEILSFDSRQIYKKLNIGTGKDLPTNASWTGDHWIIDGVDLWGYDIISPTENFSVAHYIRYAKKVLKEIWGRKKLAIMVGGTGLYIKAVLDGVETAEIPRNLLLRAGLDKKDPQELYDSLANIDGAKAASLNASDRVNKRRLIRAIEIAQWKIDNQKISKTVGVYENCDCMILGLSLSPDELKKRIKKRVQDRVKKGQDREVTGLITSGVNWESQAMTSLGYRQYKNYLDGEISRDDLVSRWIKDEYLYAKRQITWFKSDRRIMWIDAKKQNFYKRIEKMLKIWQNRN